MKKIYLVLILSSLTGIRMLAQIPDWSTSIATILYSNCTVCHHEGGIAPFSLITYDDAINNAFQMQSDVNAKVMPPWPADPDFSHFKDERVLSDYDISQINDWV